MTKWRSVLSLALVAFIATVTGHVPFAPGARSWSLAASSLKRHSAAKQLPQGFVLPSSDVDLKVSSLVVADLDADGDLDIIAADTSDGSPGIVVWENDGAGRLTRKRPAQPSELGSEPASPSVGERQTSVAVSIQPDSPAIQPAGTDAWLTLPGQRRERSLSPAAISGPLGILGSRAPPALS